MTAEENVRALWAAFDRFDFQAAAPLLHDDFVCEWPQSQERIRGRDNFIAVNAHYPGQWRCSVRTLIVSGDAVVTETDVSDGEVNFVAVSFFTLAEDKIVHLREYWPEPYAAQDWRKQWVESI